MTFSKHQILKMSSYTVFYAEFESASHLSQFYNEIRFISKKQILFSKFCFLNFLFDPHINLAYKKHVFLYSDGHLTVKVTDS